MSQRHFRPASNAVTEKTQRHRRSLTCACCYGLRPAAHRSAAPQQFSRAGHFDCTHVVSQRRVEYAPLPVLEGECHRIVLACHLSNAPSPAVAPAARPPGTVKLVVGLEILHSARDGVILLDNPDLERPARIVSARLIQHLARPDWRTPASLQKLRRRDESPPGPSLA